MHNALMYIAYLSSLRRAIRVSCGSAVAFPGRPAVREKRMAESSHGQRRPSAQPIAELVGRVLDPVTRRRGFATADLIAAWPDIAGSRFAALTRPLKIVWPRGEANEGLAGVLTLQVEGPSAILVQHELGQMLERINSFLGYRAVSQVRIVQAPVTQSQRRRPRQTETPLAAEEENRLVSATVAVEDDALRQALQRLGRGVLARRQDVTGRSR